MTSEARRIKIDSSLVVFSLGNLLAQLGWALPQSEWGLGDSEREAERIHNEMAAAVIRVAPPGLADGLARRLLAARDAWATMLRSKSDPEVALQESDGDNDGLCHDSLDVGRHLGEVTGLLEEALGADEDSWKVFSLGQAAGRSRYKLIEFHLSGRDKISPGGSEAAGHSCPVCNLPLPAEWDGTEESAYGESSSMSPPLTDAVLDQEGRPRGEDNALLVSPDSEAVHNACQLAESGRAPTPPAIPSQIESFVPVGSGEGEVVVERAEPPMSSIGGHSGESAVRPREPREASILEDAGSARAADASVSHEDYTRLRAIKDRIDPNNTYIGYSLPLLRVFERIDLLNRSPEKPVLILGKSGSGKSKIAKLIHDSSGRKGRYCEEHASGNISQDLASVRSKWVGTGPNSGLPDRKGTTPGLLRDCAGGTIFLDEVGDLTKGFELFLQQIIDKVEIRPNFGELPPFKPDVRLILATLKDLEAEVESHQFRGDLLRRLRGRIIRIPDLVDRLEDIFYFVRAMLPGRTPTAPFLLALLEHDWPGQVGELKEVLEEVRDRCGRMKAPLTLDLLPMLPGPVISRAKALGAEEAEGRVCRKLAAILRQQGFEKHRGLYAEMARFLGTSRSTMTRLARKHLDERVEEGSSIG